MQSSMLLGDAILDAFDVEGLFLDAAELDDDALAFVLVVLARFSDVRVRAIRSCVEVVLVDLQLDVPLRNLC